MKISFHFNVYIRKNPRLLKNFATVIESKCLDNFRLDIKHKQVTRKMGLYFICTVYTDNKNYVTHSSPSSLSFMIL